VIIGEFLSQLEELAKSPTPLITGGSNSEQEQLYQAFPGWAVGRLVLSRVGNFAIDLPMQMC